MAPVVQLPCSAGHKAGMVDSVNGCGKPPGMTVIEGVVRGVALVVAILACCPGAATRRDGNEKEIEEWIRSIRAGMRDRVAPGSDFQWRKHCMPKNCANDAAIDKQVQDFEFSAAARPSREFWNEEAVVAAMRSQTNEPSFEDFYNRGLPIEEPLPVPRYTLEELGGWKGGKMASLLRSGVPVLVTDAHKSFPHFFKYSWTCEDIARRFSWLPDHLDALYGSITGNNEGMPFSKFFDLLEEDPSRTLYWSPKSHQEEIKLLAPLLGVKEGFAGLPPDKRHVCMAAKSPEFWFQRPKSGAKPHIDEHCCNTISIGLNGDKVWELGPIDTPQTHPGFANGMFGQFGYQWLPVYDDGFYGSDKWKPVFKTTVRQGEALIFPPLLIHRTFAARGPDGSTSSRQTADNLRESCTNSLTMQFDYPLASAYLRAFWPRIFANPSSSQCAPMWHRAMALDPDLMSELRNHSCGSYCEMQLKYIPDEIQSTLRDTREARTAISQAHISSIMQRKGNATHFSLIGDLYPNALRSADASGNRTRATSVEVLAALDAAQGFTNFGVHADSDGNTDVVLEKEDFHSLIARLNSVREKYSRDLRLFGRRSPIAMPLWIPLSFACYGERIVLQAHLLQHALVVAARETFDVAFHDLNSGVGYPTASSPICRSFYNLDKWLLSGNLFYLFMAIMYLLTVAAVAVLLVRWWQTRNRSRAKGTMSTERTFRQRRRK